MNGREEFARYIKAARETTGLSKFSAGKGLGYQSDGTINALEQGRMPLPVEQIHRIAKLYKLNVDEVLDKIKECEPRLYKRYLLLQEDIISYFAKQVAIQRSGSSSAEQARHHRPFANELFGELTYNISYQNLKSMEQMVLDLRERSLHDNNQKVLVFAHARQRRIAKFHPYRNLHHHQLRPAA